MKKLLLLAFVVSCGVNPSMERLGDTLTKASKDTKSEGSRLNDSVNENFEKTISDINEESIRVKDNIADEGGRFSQSVKGAAKKANEDFTDEKEDLRDRLVGTHDNQLLDIERQNAAQDKSLLQLEADVDTLFEIAELVDAELEALAATDAELASKIEEIQEDIASIEDDIDSLEEVDSLTARNLRNLRRKIRRVASNDDYCTVEEETTPVFPIFLEHVVTLHCPNGSYEISRDYHFNF